MTDFTKSDYERLMALVKNIPPRLEFFSSNYAVTPDGEREHVIRLSFKDRFFSWPWKPWIKTKTVMVPNYKPAIFRFENKIIYHPAFEEQVRKGLRKYSEYETQEPDILGFNSWSYIRPELPTPPDTFAEDIEKLRLSYMGRYYRSLYGKTPPSNS